MKSLSIINNNVYMDSRQVAPMIGLEHVDLLAGITHMVDILRENNQNVSDKFIPYVRGGNTLWYRLSRSGCDAVAVELTPDETTRILFINEYTNRFRRGEKKLAQLMSEDWQRKRKMNIVVQSDFSDTIKELVTYAEQSGSKNANYYYTDYNKLLNRTVGLMDGERDEATSMQLDNLNKANMMAGKIIKEGIAKGKDYHDIYKEVKQAMSVAKDIFGMALFELPEGEA